MKKKGNLDLGPWISWAVGGYDMNGEWYSSRGQYHVTRELYARGLTRSNPKIDVRASRYRGRYGWTATLEWFGARAEIASGKAKSFKGMLSRVMAIFTSHREEIIRELGKHAYRRETAKCLWSVEGGTPTPFVTFFDFAWNPEDLFYGKFLQVYRFMPYNKPAYDHVSPVENRPGFYIGGGKLADDEREMIKLVHNWAASPIPEPPRSTL